MSAFFARIADSALRRPEVAILCAMPPAALLYFALLTHGAFHLFPFTWYGLTFNSMLTHLLHGQFDVDPDTISTEGFLVDGKTYAYFGIFPALFRGLFAPFVDLKTTNLTIVSCVTATVIMVAAQLWATLAVFRRFAGDRERNLLWPLLAIGFLAGPQIAFLRPSIYQEVVLWSLAQAYLFVAILIAILFLGSIARSRTLAALAALAGLALLTRAPVGVGLYAAMGALFAAVVLKPATRASVFGEDESLQSVIVRIAPAVLVLGLFAAIAGYVNFMRFGDPTKFIDPRFHIMSVTEFPDRMARLTQYGEFNVARIWYGLGYYFFPVWLFHQSDGALVFAAFRHRLIDVAELPASSFFISDPLLLGFTGFGIAAAFRRLRTASGPSILMLSVVAGLLVPCVLECIAWAYAFRYRGDFYPLFLFGALEGLCYFLQRPTGQARVRLIWAAAGVSIVVSIILLGLYYMSPFGDPEKFLAHGWIEGYHARLLEHSVETGP